MTARKQQVTVRADLRGYALRGEAVDGFDDRPELPLVDRVAIARMARSYAPSALTGEQRRLLARDDARPRRASALLRGFTQNTLEDEEGYRVGLYAQLSARQRAAIAETDFPVSVGELTRLVGATDRQIRHWTDCGLLPAHRVAGQRRYFSAAAAHAAALLHMKRYEVATVAKLVRPSPDTAPLVHALGVALTTLAQRVGGDEVQRDLVEAGVRLQHVGTMKIKKQLVSDHGFGFIAQSDGTEVTFHRSQIEGAGFASHRDTHSASYQERTGQQRSKKAQNVTTA